jgi:hypothetical protein
MRPLLRIQPSLPTSCPKLRICSLEGATKVMTGPYEGILWTKFITYCVLQNFDQWGRVKRSEEEWR